MCPLWWKSSCELQGICSIQGPTKENIHILRLKTYSPPAQIKQRLYTQPGLSYAQINKRNKHLELHLDRRLTWHKLIFAQRKQLGITLTKMYWLLGRKSKHSTSNKLLIYKTIFKSIWTLEYNSGVRLPLPT
jgi:hypothetical protein